MSATKTIKLNADIHRQLKIMAAEENVTLSELIGRLLDAAFPGRRRRGVVRLSNGVELEPVTDENMTEEERAALREAEEERKAGRLKPIESIDVDPGKAGKR